MDDRDGRAFQGRDGRDPPGVHSRTQDVLLDHYAEMRADIREGDRSRSRRLLFGVATVAVVLAFAYVEPRQPWVVSAVPVVLTMLFVAHVAAENRALRRKRQVVVVERLLGAPGVDFERGYGALSRRGSRLRNELPTYALAGCFVVLWLGAMAAGLVEFHANPPSVAGWTVSTALPAVVYLVLVAMVTLSAWTFLATRSEHRRATYRLPGAAAGQRSLDEFVDEEGAETPEEAAEADEVPGVGAAPEAVEDDEADEGPGVDEAVEADDEAVEAENEGDVDDDVTADASGDGASWAADAVDAFGGSDDVAGVAGNMPGGDGAVAASEDAGAVDEADDARDSDDVGEVNGAGDADAERESDEADDDGEVEESAGDAVGAGEVDETDETTSGEAGGAFDAGG